MLVQLAGYSPFCTGELTSPTAAMIGSIGYHNQAASFLVLCGGCGLLFGVGKKGRSALFIIPCSLLVLGIAMRTGCRGAFLGMGLGFSAMSAAECGTLQKTCIAQDALVNRPAGARYRSGVHPRFAAYVLGRRAGSFLRIALSPDHVENCVASFSEPSTHRPGGRNLHQ